MKLFSTFRPDTPERQGHGETERELVESRNRMDNIDASLRLLQRRLEVIKHR